MNMIGDMGRYTQYQDRQQPFRWRRRTKAASPASAPAWARGVGIGQANELAAMARPSRPAARRNSPCGGDPNRWRRPPVSADEVVATLEKLHGLVAKGILSQAEFDVKKAELLGKLV
jgi:hypothetical protein